MTEPLLYGFQLRAVRKLVKLKGRALVAIRTGRGKTHIVMAYLKRRPNVRPAIIVTQAGLKKNWEEELWNHYGIRGTILEGTNPLEATPSYVPPVVILSYNLVGPTRTGPGWLQWLRALKPQLVVFDEAQALASMYSKQTKNCRSLANGVPQVVMTTATPITNRPIDLFPLVNILWPKEFPSFVAYGMRFGQPRRVPWGIGWEFKGASNVEELRDKLLKLGMIRDREDTLKLPDFERTIVPLPMSDPKEYHLAETEFLKWLAQRNPARLSSAERAERLVQLSYLRQLAASLKLPAAWKWVEENKTTDKMILYAIHKEVVARTLERYKGKAVVIDGSVPSKKRQGIVQEFLTNNKYTFLIGNIRAAGAGWSAPGVPQTAFLEYPWKPADLAQCEGRTRGIKRGKKGEKSRYLYLVAEKSIEIPILKLLQTKQEIQDAVIDGGKIVQKFDIFTMLTKELLKGEK